MTNTRSQKKSRAGLIIFLFLIAGGLAVFAYFNRNWFTHEFLYAGTLEATKVDVSVQLPSTIAEIKAREGEVVAVGQEVVQLKCEDVQVGSRLANQNYARAERLLKTGTLTKEAFDQTESRKEEMDLKMSWCSVTSPIKGTVLTRYREPGEWVGPGMKVLTLANIKDIWAFIYVPQSEVSKLKMGQKLVGIVPEIPNREFVGIISKINPEAEFTPKNVQSRSERTRLVFGVKLSFLGANDDEILKPGMTVEMKLP